MRSLYQILEIPETADSSATESAFSQLSSFISTPGNKKCCFRRKAIVYAWSIVRQLSGWDLLRNNTAAPRQLFDRSYRYEDKLEFWAEILAYIVKYEGKLRKHVMIEFPER